MRVKGSKKIAKVSRATRKVIASRAKKKRAMLAAARALKTKIGRLKTKVSLEVDKLKLTSRKLDKGIEELMGGSFSADFTIDLENLLESFVESVETIVSNLDDVPESAKEIPRFEV